MLQLGIEGCSIVSFVCRYVWAIVSKCDESSTTLLSNFVQVQIAVPEILGYWSLTLWCNVQGRGS